MRLSDDPRLTTLTRLGQRLPGIGNAEAAALEVVRAMAPLGLAGAVATIHADVAVIVAINVPSELGLRLPASLATRLVGMRIPLEGVDAFRHPVHLRSAYHGPAGAVATLRSLNSASDLTQFLPSPGDEGAVISVPVMSRDRVSAVVAAWGPGVSDEMVPTIEAAAAMLAAAWAPDRQPDVERFPTLTPARPNARLRRVLDSLLMDNSIAAAVQPIIRLHDRSVIGYEALARFPPRAQVRTPDELFASASSLNMQDRVDLACLRAALAEAPKLGEADLFVNVLIGTLLDRAGMAALNDAVREAGVDPRSVVLEFSEREPVTDLARLQRIAAEVRAGGFRIAVDDAGAGHASMRVIAELRPEFIKVDRSLIHAVDSDRARRALVVALLSFSGHIGARLIAEGIETEAEREMLSTLGVMFGQGWLPGMPVLTAALDGHDRVEVVDAAWFARQHVSRTREILQPDTAGPGDAPSLRAAAPPSLRGRGLPRALSAAALALQNEHDPVRIVGVMAELMLGVVPVSEMAIFAADYETHRMVPMYATGTDRDELLADSFSLDAGLTGWAFARGRPENVPDTSKHPLARQVPGTPVVDESLLLIPLVAGEHKLGIINCWRLGLGQFSDREVEAASLFAHIAAAAWRNAQLYSELLSAAMTDPLTRLYNSRWLRDTGERDLLRAAREGKPLSLLLIDLDHFKRVNDGGGHAAGDLVLQRVAARLRSTVRGMDAVVRLGGEEFVALLQDCDADGAAVVAEAVRVAVRDIALPEGCGLPRLTASIGIAAYPEHAGDLEPLIAAADRAMYVAKQGGRDRITRAAAPADTSTIVNLRKRRRRRPAATRPVVLRVE
ncbi:MAG: EAL domain-containing protein [Candidatus Dormibacteraeota bacterium]|uniref:EAL domain-containing protein n=1 Tax=Candidatus Aeolococcus gillhamiae TaxID=3127015 RepID=A0A934JXS8_9BACT|nr:EAL domain-containing protein [Candidatus Dormibacteraeota bacterium]